MIFKSFKLMIKYLIIDYFTKHLSKHVQLYDLYEHSKT